MNFSFGFKRTSALSQISVQVNKIENCQRLQSLFKYSVLHLIDFLLCQVPNIEFQVFRKNIILKNKNADNICGGHIMRVDTITRINFN